MELLASGFVENRGQFGVSDVRFVGSAGNLRVGLAPSGVYILLQIEAKNHAAASVPSVPDLAADHQGRTERVAEALVRIDFVGAHVVEPQGSSPLAHESNFFLGRGSSWTGVRSFAEVVYPSLYEGIDLVYRMTPQGPKYEFRVAGGADESAILVRYSGVDGVEPTPNGDLLLRTGGGDLIDAAPTAFEGDRPTSCAFDLVTHDTTAFRCKRTSPDVPLTIDPLVFSTYLGGFAGDGELGVDVVAGVDGTLYATGDTLSSDFPTTSGANDTSWNGNSDAFVVKLAANGTALEFATFLGGDNDDVPTALRVGGNGTVFFVGWTDSTNFPTTPNAFLANYSGGNGSTPDGFVVRLAANGSSLEYSTYLGGSESDTANDVGVDSNGSAYVVGRTFSDDFPVTAGSFNSSATGLASISDAFVAKFTPNGTSLEYGSFLGGAQNDDAAFAIEVDDLGEAFVAGFTQSDDFPTTSGAHDTQIDSNFNGFVTKFDANGSTAIYSTYLGGSDDAYIWGMDIDGNGSAYAVGEAGANFPTTSGAYDTVSNGGVDGFLAKFDANGTSLAYSTFVGGSGYDAAVNVAVDTGGNAYLVGYTVSSDMPATPDAVNRTYGGLFDGYLAIVSAPGDELVYGSYLGGTGYDYLDGVDVSANGTAYIGGYTESSDFPVTGSAYQQSNNGGGDAVLSRISFPATGEVSVLTEPPGLELELNGSLVASNTTLNCAARTNVTLKAPSPQGSNETRYTFSNWSDGGAQNHTTRCYIGAVFVASFNTEHKVNVTTNPPDRNLSVDGLSVVGPQSYWWENGTEHDLGITSPQVLGLSRYSFSDWSDGGAMNRTVTVDGPLNLVANFTLEHQVNISTVPVGRSVVLDAVAVAGPQSYWWVDGSTHDVNVNSPQVTGDTRYLISNWSDAGAVNRTIIVSGPINLTANFTTEHFVRLTTTPAARELTVDGTSMAAPRSFWWGADSDHVLDVRSPQVLGDTRYVFSNWSDGGATNRTVRISGPFNLTAAFATEHFFRLTTLPAGRDLTIDGVRAPAPQSYWWLAGSRHDLNVTSPQVVGETRYLFSSWSDGRAINHTMTVAGPLNLTVNFTTEHRGRVTTTPAGRLLLVDGLGVTPPASWWWTEGSSHTVEAISPQTEGTSRYQLVSWSDGGARRHSIVATGPVDVTADFSIEFLAELLSSPPGREVIVDGAPYTTPSTFWWDSGSSHSFEAPSPQPVGDTRYVFVNWSNAGARNQSLPADSPLRLTATFGAEYNVTFGTDPPGLSVSVDGASALAPASFWLAAGDIHSLGADSPQVTGQTRWTFVTWSDNGGLSHPISISGPASFVARFHAEYLVTFDTDPAGLPLDVDGVSSAAPRSLWWSAGGNHFVGAQALVTQGTVRHVFAAWSDGGDRTHYFVVSGAAAIVASFETEYQVAIHTDPNASLNMTVDGSNVSAPATVWWASGSIHQLAVPSPQGSVGTRYVFRAWANSSDPQERSFTVTSSANLTAQFDREYEVALETEPPGLSVMVDGASVRTPATVWWVANTTHSIELQSEQTLNGTGYRFESWSHGGAASQNLTAERPVRLRAAFAPLGGSGDSGGLQAFAPFALLLAVAVVALVGLMVWRRRAKGGAAGKDDERPADASSPSVATTPGAVPPPPEGSGAALTEGAPAPCPQCGSPLAIGVSPCPQCGLELVWG